MQGFKGTVMNHKHRRFDTWIGVAIAVLGIQVCHAQAVDPNAQLRGVDLGGRTVDVPGGAFQESPIVTKLCQPDSQRALVRDGSGRSFVNEADLRQVMLQGRQIAEASDGWARQVIMQTQIQKALPSRAATEFKIVADPDWAAKRNKPAAPAASPQQASLDYNFAVLDAKGAQLDGRAQGHYANLWALELNTLITIAKAGLPPLETLALLKQFEWFSEENNTCAHERSFGQKAAARYVEMGWPTLHREKPAASAVTQAERERGKPTLAATQAEFSAVAAPSIVAARPLVTAELAKARASNDVARVISTVFGTGRLSKMAMQDPEIRRSFESRATALRIEEQKQLEAQLRRLAAEEEKRAAAKRTRIATSIKNNSAPVLSDLQAIVLQQSLLASIEDNPGVRGEATSTSGYQLSAEFLGQTFETATVEIDVSGLTCRPAGGMHDCSYTETFSWTRYALFESLELPRGSKTEQKSVMLKWTTDGLTVDGKIRVRSLGWVSTGSGGTGKKEKVCVTVSLNGFQDCRYY